ncbi:MAG: hypothetical protein CMJ47_01005 [Planctomyces sp.]|nr:hypothetical protein [Planctomyces sp.]
MSDYDQIRRDNEYQKEVRRRKMTDAAKIGLLVAQNVQQYHTNQILAQVHTEACRTNHFLGHMVSTLDQIAQMQETHFEQVQRERSLKEVIFQFEKFLDETEAYSDPIAAAFGMKRLFEVLDHPDNGFSTADLSDLSDKRHFDLLTTRAKGLLTGLPRQEFIEMEEFEQLLGVYHERTANGFNAEKAFPKKPREQSLSVGTNNQEDDAKPPKSGAVEKADNADGIAILMLLVGGFMSFIGLVGVPKGIADMSAGRRMVTQSGESYPAIVPLSICAVMGVIGVGILVYAFSTRGKRKALREHADRTQQEANERFEKKQVRLRKEREAELRSDQARLAQKNKKIDAENAKIEEKRRQATKLFEATMEEMRSLINGFLDQHPPIQKFVPRV